MIASALLLGACSSIDAYKGPIAIPNTPERAPTLALGAAALSEYQRNLHWCIAEVKLLPQHWNAKGIAIDVLTGAVQGFVEGAPTYAVSRDLVPAEITAGAEGAYNLATGVSNNLQFFSTERIGWVNECMQARLSNPSAPYIILR